MIIVNGKEISFDNGMTVADALHAAGEDVDFMTLVVIEGKVLQRDMLNVVPIADGAQIRLLRILSGG